MAILLTRNDRVIVQGITGNQGRFHTRQMLAYGTPVVGGVSPTKGGQDVEGVPVYDTVREAVENTRATASIVFVPAPFAKDAAFEAMENGIRLIVMIPEHIPVQDSIDTVNRAKTVGATIIGPNTFGIISPSEHTKMGIMPNHIYTAGPVGVVARSGTLSYEIAFSLSQHNLGQTTVVGMGGDPVVGQTFITVLEQFRQDPDTRCVVMVGEIGGSAEEEAAEYLTTLGKPVVVYLAGRAAPAGKRMGHAGAIIERGKGTLASKEKALKAHGAEVVTMPWQVAEAVRSVLG
ncbi:succinate--CoA ligase subunit alpha [Sulfobacillus thermosulfidooxidans]|uniref:succinate--CoA ligase subunit alpha n=1 Tax=Sulfobacillus thermosulfidooxidans TaxID=28034 RepID=UPI00096BA128|nr:succinate--CoA ligase subunit alpha [Sulfobacillus thermosulfidooxidans]OLZ09847.1 succinate--CoA ligase subunit alpha [Sulfobacillus thermosulfidooxidans]OLZ15847.1 succinate--CoA ligase subunit alpha [Sulfobacillus thermosulfidooxidans]OLZ18306.1 succinate--CoA ligase subunit alpha [Sulfobacillus thermosulfidooxidans]